MILRVGNEAKIAAEAIGTYLLRLLSGVRLDLKDCYYVPVASRNLIFVSVLAQEGLKLVSIKIYFIYLRNKLVAGDLLIDSLYHLYVDVNVNLNE